MSGWQFRGGVKVAYLERYAQHPDFVEALEALYSAHVTGEHRALLASAELWQMGVVTRHPGDEWAAGYLEALSQLARRFGLDRLEPAGRGWPSGGEEAIHNWCGLRARADLQGSPWRPPFWMVEAGGAQPDVDGRVEVHIEAEWRPDLESLGKAKERLLVEARRQIERQLADIAARAEAASLTFRDTRPKMREHLGWLFRHVALGESFDHIGGGYTKGPDVYKQVKFYADLLGIPMGRNYPV
jgi:hypothetical protein